MPNRSNSAGLRTTGRSVRTRRGAAEVEQAIADAVVVELAEVGFGRLTFDSVAERAGTGKSPLYRRWAGTTALGIDTLERLGKEPPRHAGARGPRGDRAGLPRFHN